MRTLGNFALAAWMLLLLVSTPALLCADDDTPQNNSTQGLPLRTIPLRPSLPGVALAPSGSANSDAAIDAISSIPISAAASGGSPKKTSKETPSFDWKPALGQSFAFLSFQHAFRFATEPGTRSGLSGPFMKDYVESLRGLSGWGDGDPFIVNYVGHPMMGAVTGLIQVQNDKAGRMATFGRSKEYWNSRLRAMAFSAVYSVQFELGPYSEAALGNVGLDRKTMGWVDIVVTPIGGTGWVVMEDALDALVATPLERLHSNVVWKASIRSVLNPARSFTNVLRGRLPWFRDTRTL